jgi:hypothetical protein
MMTSLILAVELTISKVYPKEHSRSRPGPLPRAVAKPRPMYGAWGKNGN